MTAKIHWAVLPADEAGAGGRTSGRRVRLGDQALVWSAEAEPVAPGARTGSVTSALSLVTQVGRAFQDAHPDVPVILDHGRHLVVEGGEALRGKDDTCWRVEPLPPGPVVVDRPERRVGPVSAAVTKVLEGVTRPPYESDLTWISQLETRHSLSEGFRQAADRAEMALTTLGYATSRQPVSVGGGQSANVIAARPGRAAADRGAVLVTAHLDSVNQAGGTKAPGADDNGSGAAGLLLLARVLAGHEWENDLRLILFGGEEQGLFGSKQYVAGLPAAERGRIRAVLNMDMIGVRNGPEPGVLLEGAPVSRQLIDDLATAAGAVTGLRVETSLSPFASDHVPFIVAGVPAVLTIEGNDAANGTIHSENDLLTHIDYGLAVEILRMNAAALAGWLRPVEEAG
ncbi:M28 family metallopeptidase [Actinoplanes sp. NPDC048988]|uniref:M28 family metallopeptidase n=1 Tax=Actinoplanes sp. NPDC048988 TaxID=3363901 RepID=UPI003713178A